MARQVKVITAAEAAALIKNGDTVTTSGFVASAIPEALDRAVEERFLATGEPRDITYVYCGSQGNKDGRGAEHFAHEGLLKRYIAGHWATVPLCRKWLWKTRWKLTTYLRVLFATCSEISLHIDPAASQR